MMFRHLLKKNGINLSDYGISPLDLIFIEEIIQGADGKARRGRERDKFYLYDIVNNVRSGLDVDKLDYLQRDILHANTSGGAPIGGLANRIIENGRVLHAEAVPGDPSDLEPDESSEDALVEVDDKGRGRERKASRSLMICFPEKLCKRYHICHCSPAFLDPHHCVLLPSLLG